MNKKHRSQHGPSGDFTEYLNEYQNNSNDDESIASSAIDSDISDIDGEIIKIGNKNDNHIENKSLDIQSNDRVDLDGLFDTLNTLGGKNSQIANLYKTIDNEKEEVQPLLEHQHKKYYRQAAYKTISKEVESWIPQVTSNEFKELITYGKSVIEVKPQLLTSDITPINDFERELAQAESDVKLMHQEPKEDVIEMTRVSKSVIHRENMKNKQKNRIKSKNWHRGHRKGKEYLQEKLISRVELEDPELAKQIKYEIQIKAAERRLLRKREAQNRWAKMAIRYGGKEARALASKQSQSLNDYEKNIISLAKKDDSSDSESPDLESESESESEHESLETKHSKVYNMKFMKNAKQQQESEDQSEDSDGELHLLESNVNKNHSMDILKRVDDENHKSSNTISNKNVVEDLVIQKRELNRILTESTLANENNDLVCEIFTGNDQLLTDSEDEEVEHIQSGWGKWISKVNNNNDNNKEIKKRRVRVKTVNDSDKLSSYTIKKLPYPHSNTKSFNSTLDRPLGPEWNTAKAHKRLIQPKVEIKVGNIIIPIQKKNIGNKREVDSLLRAFGKASRAQRTLARL